jgi:hypothetical protein
MTVRTAWAVAVAIVAGCGSQAAPDCPGTVEVPAAIAAPAGLHVAFVLHATGIQRYACDGAAWQLVAPHATLTDDGGAMVGTHGAGPSWEISDGSGVRGAKRAATVVDPGAIPWLLVDVTAHEGMTGRLSDVTAIQRVHTAGGLAPHDGCDAAHRDAVTDVPYTADYVFLRPGARCSVSLRRVVAAALQSPRG